MLVKTQPRRLGVSVSLGLALCFLGLPAHMSAAPEASMGEQTVPAPKAERLASIARFQQACADLGRPSTNLLVGLATSMEKLLPRAHLFSHISE